MLRLISRKSLNILSFTRKKSSNHLFFCFSDFKHTLYDLIQLSKKKIFIFHVRGTSLLSAESSTFRPIFADMEIQLQNAIFIFFQYFLDWLILYGHG